MLAECKLCRMKSTSDAISPATRIRTGSARREETRGCPVSAKAINCPDGAKGRTCFAVLVQIFIAVLSLHMRVCAACVRLENMEQFRVSQD